MANVYKGVKAAQAAQALVETGVLLESGAVIGATSVTTGAIISAAAPAVIGGLATYAVYRGVLHYSGAADMVDEPTEQEAHRLAAEGKKQSPEIVLCPIGYHTIKRISRAMDSTYDNEKYNNNK